MSAIVGIYRRDGQSVDQVELDRMLFALAHRGPDGSHAWRDEAIGLGHQMLHTTSESLHERLPLVASYGDLAITCDARIDNRDELIKLLPFNGRPAREITDGELILAAYQQWGQSCPEKLLGDFAFAIWDGRRRRLVCARDHFGVKPFYCYVSNELFAFATEIKALLTLPEIPRRLNEARVGDFLVGLDDVTSTFYQEVLRLPPAHVLTVDESGQPRLRRYWALDPTREVRLGSDEEYALALRDLFTEAVRCRMRTPFPLGSMLSGGLDSSSITCMANRLLEPEGAGPLHTFSARFNTVSECDERVYQDAVLAENHVAPHFVDADEYGPLHDLDRILWHLDEPNKAGNLYFERLSYEIAQSHGVRVILDGFDGDSTISHGLGYLPELASAGRWLTLMREVKAYAPRCQESWPRAAWQWTWSYEVEPHLSRHRALRPAHRVVRSMNRRILPRAATGDSNLVWLDLINPEFADRCGVNQRTAAQPRPATCERDAHFLRITHAGMPNALEILDRIASASSVEVRFPFWDKRLAEFCLGLPTEQKMQQGWTRLIMRRAMDGILPTKVQWRGGKTNMLPSFNYGLRNLEQQRLCEVIIENSGAIEAFIDTTKLRDVYDRFLLTQANDQEVNAMWRAVCLGLWLHRADLRQPTRKGGEPYGL